MISAFDVYLIMQLDSLKGFLEGMIAVCIVFGTIGFFALVAGVADQVNKLYYLGKTMLKWFVPFAIFFGFLHTVVPSTKTAAAMIVLPVVTSQETLDTIKPEMKELYELTKKSLESIANPKEVEK